MNSHPPAPAYRVLLVAGDPLARYGLQAMLGPPLEVVGLVAPDGVREALAARAVDVLVWDVGSGGREAVAALSAGEGSPVVVLADDRWAAEALSAGARAVVPRDAPAPRLQAAIHAVAEGLVAVDGAFAEGLSVLRPSGDAGEELTPRELEVLGLLAQGLPNKGIASALGISEHTAKFHVNAILAKLGAQSRTDAVVRAARRGLLML